MNSGPLCARLLRILTWCSRKRETVKAVVPQIKSRERSIHEAKWTIFTKWFRSNQVDIRAKFIADFILYLFQDRKLQPSTIDGYRSAITDTLGNSPINVRK